MTTQPKCIELAELAVTDAKLAYAVVNRSDAKKVAEKQDGIRAAQRYVSRLRQQNAIHRQFWRYLDLFIEHGKGHEPCPKHGGRTGYNTTFHGGSIHGCTGCFTSPSYQVAEQLKLERLPCRTLLFVPPAAKCLYEFNVDLRYCGFARETNGCAVPTIYISAVTFVATSLCHDCQAAVQNKTPQLMRICSQLYPVLRLGDLANLALSYVLAIRPTAICYSCLT